MDFTTMSNEALTAALDSARETATKLFALTEPTVEQVNEAETVLASVRDIETEQASRASIVADAANRFAAARASFANEDGEGEATEGEASEEEVTEEPAVEAALTPEEEAADEAADATDGNDDEEDRKEAMTASANHRTSQKVSVAAAVARRNKRPEVKATNKVTITAAADVPGFATGSSLDGMEGVAKALTNRVKGFAKFNAQAAAAVDKQSGGEPVLNKFGVASFTADFAPALTASAGNDYNAFKTALREHDERLRASMQPGTKAAMTAAGWCAPSQTVYSYIADYVVDGLITVPEVNAPRGGLLLTTGPARSSQGTALDDFGFVQTEAQAIAGQVKTCETIVCPDFVDHRLDAIGYCYKIPLLTQKAYPELITDALRFADVLYAHKVNRRIISDLVALSTPVAFNGYGPSFTDTLEALSLIAVKERRKWNIGENAILEVKLPVWVKEVFRADMSRRAAVAFDSVSDAQIQAHFNDRKLAVEYVADWQELTGVDARLPGTFQAMMYPSGTFIKAVEDVVSLSAVYDAASLSVNEYTGVFFEQGILTAKAAYGSSLVTVGINTAGEMGALSLVGLGDSAANGSF